MLEMNNKEMELHKSGFSWARVWMVVKYYYPTLRNQIKWYPIVTVGLCLIVSLLQLAGGVVADASIGVFGAFSFMFYWAPVVLCRHESRLTTTQLPVTAAEIAVVLFGYFFVVIPMLLFGIEYAFAGITHYIAPEMSILDKIMTNAYDVEIEHKGLYIALMIFFSVLPAMLCLWSVVHFRQNRTLKAILVSGGVYIGTSVIAGIIAAIFAFKKGFEDGINGREFDEASFANEVASSMVDLLVVMGFIAMVVVVVMAIRTYKEIKNYQI